MPRVSIVIPTYNREQHVAVAVASILNQSYRDFEVLVIDDGSTDDTPRLFERFLTAPRLRYVRLERNGGISAARNTGVELATGDYIGFLDSDDAAYSDRLARQVAVLDRQPEIAIVGGQTDLIDRGGNPLVLDPARLSPFTILPAADLWIRWRALYNSPFATSTVMVRAAVLREHALRFQSRYDSAEDYLLWSEVLEHGRGVNLPEPLILYRLHEAQVTRTNAEFQTRSALAIAAGNLLRLGVHIDDPHYLMMLRRFIEGGLTYDHLVAKQGPDVAGRTLVDIARNWSLILDRFRRNRADDAEGSLAAIAEALPRVLFQAMGAG